jgi:two-component system response regulator NreC
MAGVGLRTLEKLSTIQPPIRAVVLALHEDISLLRSALATRALGYVVHRGSKIELLSVIRKIYRGRGYVEVPTGGLPLDPGVAPDSAKRRELDGQLELLSKREKEVLRAVAYGYTNREIAEHLGISVKSVETYRYRLSDKLEFGSRAELVRFALDLGLLRPESEGLPEAT